MNKQQRNEFNALVQQFAEQLGETERPPRYQIANVIRVCGVEFAQALLEETLRIEAEGGLMLPDGSRRRTPGGTFFFLVRQRVDAPTRNAIFYAHRRKGGKKKDEDKQPPADQEAKPQPDAAAPKQAAASAEAAPPPARNRQRPTLPPAQQLQKLLQAEDQARDRFEAIKELPPEEQVGLSAALRDLKVIKEQIRLLRQRYPELR